MDILKNRKFIALIAVVLALAVIGFLVYNIFGYNNPINDADNTVIDNSVQPTTVVNYESDMEIRKLYSYVNDVQSLFCDQSTLEAATAENNSILAIAYNAVDSSALTQQNGKTVFSAEAMAQAVQKVFGNERKYTDDSFYTGNSKLDGSIEITYEPETKQYTVGEKQKSNGAFAYQFISSVKKNDSEIEIDVHVFYVKEVAIESETDDMLYTVYSGYNSKQNTFETRYADIRKSVFEKDVLSNTSIDGINNEKFAGFVNSSNLDSYKYIFKLDKNTENYILTGYSKN